MTKPVSTPNAPKLMRKQRMVMARPRTGTRRNPAPLVVWPAAPNRGPHLDNTRETNMSERTPETEPTPVPGFGEHPPVAHEEPEPQPGAEPAEPPEGDEGKEPEEPEEPSAPQSAA